MKELDGSCRFCNIISNIELRKVEYNPLPICDTVLYETNNFLAFPALGALVPGYLMIVSKKHINSMAYLNENELDELIDLINQLKTFLVERFNMLPILFEHGGAVGCANKSACCVDHAHWHLVPVHLSQETIILQYAGGNRISDLKKITSFRGEPYLLYVNEKNEYYISHDKVLPSQYIRKWIAKEIGHMSEWDWKKFEFNENIKKTIEVFKN